MLVLGVDVGQRDAIVEALFLLVSEMSEAVPLAAALRVESPDVVVDDTGAFLVQVRVESFAAEERS